MESDKLVKMANQIGDFFAANPDAEAAKKDIASHLKKFWNSVMIDSIVDHVKKYKGKGLHTSVREAIEQYIAP